jgi:hypothetical protein
MAQTAPPAEILDQHGYLSWVNEERDRAPAVELQKETMTFRSSLSLSVVNAGLGLVLMSQ